MDRVQKNRHCSDSGGKGSFSEPHSIRTSGGAIMNPTDLDSGHSTASTASTCPWSESSVKVHVSPR